MAVSAFTLFGELKLDARDFTRGLANADKALLNTKTHMEALEKVGSQLQSAGASLSSFGKSVTAAISLPLAAAGAAAIKSAVDFDTLRTQLKAATGDTASANSKFAELNKLAQENAGVMTKGAVATYAMLKPLGFADKTINETIKAFGKLKSANPEVDLQRMATNLGQLFDQGFEQQDLKELLGNFPRAGEILKKAFNLKSGSSDRKAIAEEMKGVMADGLTKEDFFAKFAQGINTDQFLSRVTDPIAVRFEKMAERIQLALEPVGLIILTTLERFMPPITAMIHTVSAAFMSLSPTMQTVVMVLLGMAAAAGPVLIVLGSIVTAIGTLVASAGAIGVITAVIAGLGLAMVPIIAIAGLFYQAWVDNWELVKQTFNDGVAFVQGVVEGGMAAMTAFWTEHGTAITEYATAFYTTIATVVTQVMDIISNYVKLGLQVISGDWSGAWQTFLDIVTQFATLLTSLISNALNVTVQLIQAAVPIMIQAWGYVWGTVLKTAIQFGANLVYIIATLPQQLAKLVVAFFTVGSDIAAALWAGIKAGLGLGGSATSSAGGSAFDQGFFDSLMEKFNLNNLTKGTGTITAPNGPAQTFLTPIKTDAIQTAAALDKVAEKVKAVKQTAGGITAKTSSAVDELFAIGQAAKAGVKYGKPGSGVPASLQAAANKVAQMSEAAYEMIDPLTGKKYKNVIQSLRNGSSAKLAGFAQLDPRKLNTFANKMAWVDSLASGTGPVQPPTDFLSSMFGSVYGKPMKDNVERYEEGQRVLADLSQAIKDGSVIRIIDESNGRARISTGGSAASVDNRYPGN